MNLTSSWLQRRNPLLVLIEFRTACADVWEVGFRGFSNMCWKVVLFLSFLPKVELSLFPNPPTSTTMEGFLDQRRPCARWRSAIATARYSPQQFIEASTGTHEMRTPRKDVSLSGKWRITFSRSRLLPLPMSRVPRESQVFCWQILPLHIPVLEKTELPESICRFLRRIYHDSTTHVEFAGTTRGQFLMARGVRQGCLASGFLFAMAFDPIFRWFQDAIIPRNPAGLDFLQPARRACADDLAVAPPSLWCLMTAVTPACQTVNQIAGFNLNHRKCCWVQYHLGGNNYSFDALQAYCFGINIKL